MKKVIAYIAMSLDGYIADKNGSVEWLGGDGSDITNMGSYEEFVESIDTVILGYTTYNQIVTELASVWPYKGKKSYVITHKKIADQEEIKFTDKNIKDLIEELKQVTTKNIWVCGGASIVNQLLNYNLIDELKISVIPIILGDGISLFKNNKKTNLKLDSTISYNGIVDLNYSIK